MYPDRPFVKGKKKGKKKKGEWMLRSPKKKGKKSPGPHRGRQREKGDEYFLNPE